MRLRDKVALITGAALVNGFGFASARAFVREGARVILSDVNEAEVMARGAELTADGHDVLSLAHDVTDAAAWERTRMCAVDRFGNIDIVVNNAGIANPAGIVEATLENWQAHIDINLTGVFLGCQMAGRQMRAQGDGGSIINISSIAGQQAYPGLAAYVASKGGVKMLTKAVALDLAGDNIRVNSVHPGNMRTDMMERSIRVAPDLVQSSIDKIPLKRLGRPEDIANMVLFLASDEADYITGAEFTVDGGLTAGV